MNLRHIMDLIKGRKKPTGTISHRKDGDYKKFGEDDWRLVKKGKRSKTPKSSTRKNQAKKSDTAASKLVEPDVNYSQNLQNAVVEGISDLEFSKNEKVHNNLTSGIMKNTKQRKQYVSFARKELKKILRGGYSTEKKVEASIGKAKRLLLDLEYVKTKKGGYNINNFGLKALYSYGLLLLSGLVGTLEYDTKLFNKIANKELKSMKEQLVMQRGMSKFGVMLSNKKESRNIS